MANFNPAFQPPEHVESTRFVHVIGAKVFVDDRAADEAWPRNFLGMLAGEAG